MPKIVFSNTLKNVAWKNTTLAKGDMEEEVIKLRQQPGKNILVGGPTIIIKLMQMDLIDEYQFCVQPIVLGHGLPLFKNITDIIDLKLLAAKTYRSGVVALRYERIKK
jgi:dihydrofolate reductase